MSDSQVIEKYYLECDGKKIMTYQFSESNLSFAELGVHAFSNCSALKSGDDLHF